MLWSAPECSRVLPSHGDILETVTPRDVSVFPEPRFLDARLGNRAGDLEARRKGVKARPGATRGADWGLGVLVLPEPALARTGPFVAPSRRSSEPGHEPIQGLQIHLYGFIAGPRYHTDRRIFRPHGGELSNPAIDPGLLGDDRDAGDERTDQFLAFLQRSVFQQAWKVAHGQQTLAEDGVGVDRVVRGRATTPLPSGSGSYYLVRGENVCSPGPCGEQSGRTPRTSSVCP